MPANYVLLEKITVGAAGASIAQMLADLAVAGNIGAYEALGYVLKKKVTEEGCWTLGSNINHAGYTKVTVDGKRGVAHRLLLEVLLGETIPKDKDVDHMCHNDSAAKGECRGGDSCRHRACFNPDHMRITTRSVNISSGYKSYWNQQTCNHGHQRTIENTWFTKDDLPYCKVCHMARSKVTKRAWRAKNKALGIKEKR